MQSGFVYSIILHIMLVLLLVFGLPWFSPEILPQESVISVEMLQLSEISNVKPKKKVDIKKPAPEKIKPAPSQPSPAAPEKPEPKPAPTPVEPEKPEPKPEKIPEPEPKPKPKAEPKKPEPKPKPKEQEKPKPKKKKDTNDLDSLLKNLEESVTSKEKTKEKKKKEKQETPQEEDNDSKSDKEFNPDIPLSLSEQDFIRSQVEKHWSPPAGAKDASNMSVELRVQLSQDGTVMSVSIEESSRNSGADPSFARSFDESAVRAVWMSSPFEGLPPDKYDTWKNFIFRFTPENF